MLSRVSCLVLAGSLWAVSYAGPLEAAEPTKLDRAAQAALAAQSLGEWSVVIAALEEALPTTPQPDVPYARKLLALARFERGQQLYEGMIRLAVENPTANQAQISAAARQALADFEQAYQNNPRLTAARIGAARILALPGGDRTRALASLDEALKTDPQNAVALRLRGGVRIQVGQLAEALADFDAALKLEPKDAALYESRGLVLSAMGKGEEAEQALNRSVELAPKSASPRMARARLHLMRKQPELALTDLNAALDLQPNNVVALVTRANLWEQMGKNEAMLVDLDALVKLQPQAMDVQRMRAALLVRLGKLDSAIALVRQQMAADPEGPSAYGGRLQWGVLLTAKQEYALAVEQFAAALVLDPQSASALIGRADALTAQGKQAEAIADYSRVIERNPRETYVLNNLAWLLATSPDDKNRNGSRAVDLATEACRLTDQKLPQFLGTLAAAHAEKGDFKKAVEVAEKALAMSQGPAKESLAKELASYQSEKPWRDARK